MVKKDFVCTSCRIRLISSSGSVRFDCPSCNKEEIIRCSSCRADSINYTCEGCSFNGPN